MTEHGCACGERDADDASGDIRVLLVDDHPLVRRTVAEMLSDEDDFTVVGECEDGSQVVETAARVHPDVVLMDLSMPVMNGLAATEALRAVQPEARIIMLTGEGSGARSKAAAAGADALVPKGGKPEAMLRCLRTVAGGCRCCPYCL